MLDVIIEGGVQTLDPPAPQEAESPLTDIMAMLACRLSEDWDVTLEIDPIGEVSIIVAPECETPGKPTFLIFEKNGAHRLATIRDEVWEHDCSCGTAAETVAAILAAAGL